MESKCMMLSYYYMDYLKECLCMCYKDYYLFIRLIQVCLNMFMFKLFIKYINNNVYIILDYINKSTDIT